MDLIDIYECVFCRKWVTPPDSIPSFCDGEGEGDNVIEYCDGTQCVCHDCVEMHLDFNRKFDDFQLKPNRIVPECARPTPNSVTPNKCGCDICNVMTVFELDGSNNSVNFEDLT